MELATLNDVTPVEAAEKANAIRELRRPTDEDRALLAGYNAVALGQRVINVSQTVAAGGFREDGLPRLAIARADQRTTRICLRPQRRPSWKPEDNVYAKDMRDILMFPDGRSQWDRIAESKLFTLPGSLLPDNWSMPANISDQFMSMVPLVPAEHRPGARLLNFHILYEAEWVRRTPPAPRDPALLRYFGGDLAVVLAVWELTELERAVLGQRNG